MNQKYKLAGTLKKFPNLTPFRSSPYYSLQVYNKSCALRDRFQFKEWRQTSVKQLTD